MDLISPISFAPSSLVSIGFDVDSAIKNPGSFRGLNELRNVLEVNRILKKTKEERAFSCECRLEVKWEIQSPDDGLKMATASCVIVGAASAQLPEDEAQQADAENAICANAISYLWAKCRDWFDVLSSTSAIGRVSLPAINPYSLLQDE